ncbi:MAG: orotidine-5'-phosphate decarboxylase, partial [Holophaga sp.]|nr:orotidine-5'-phosphate decarboxylase [Holophaga sp.]
MNVAQSIIDRLVVALDVPTGAEALALARTLSGRAGMFKVGLELFCAEGPGFVREVQKAGPVFLDLKLHDIPNTVHRAMEALLPLDPSLVTIHTQGGPAMIEAAAQAVKAHRQRGGRTRLLGVTVLTSLDREALARLG